MLVCGEGSLAHLMNKYPRKRMAMENKMLSVTMEMENGMEKIILERQGRVPNICIS